MAEYKEEIFLSGGLDVDSDKKAIAKGDSDFILNLIPSGDGKHGIKTSIKGNRLLSSLIDDMSSEVVGDCYDPKRNCQYVLVAISGGTSAIFKYSYVTDALTYLVSANSKLGFDINYPIFDACVIGDYLFINPRTSSPRSINVVWAENYQLYASPSIFGTTAVGTLVNVYGQILEVIVESTRASIYADVAAGTYALARETGEYAYTDTDLYFYNYPIQPVYPPVVAFGSDLTKNFNHLRRNIFQFAYRYVSRDGGISATSPFSETAIKYTAEGYSGEVQDSTTTDNKLTVTVGLPNTDMVNSPDLDRIEVLCRVSEAAGWGVWKIVGKSDWTDIITATNGVLDIDFFNDMSYPVADQDEVNTAYSALPVTAMAQSSLMNNRIAYAGLTEGMDNIIPKVTLSPEFQELAVFTTGDIGELYESSTVYDSPDWVTTFDAITDLPPVGYGVLVYVYGFGTATYVVSAVDTSASVFVSNLATFISTSFTPNVTGVSVAGGTTISFHTYFPIEGADISTYLNPEVSFYKTKGFKTGARHQFCIYYYDALMRRSGAMANEGLNVYLPFITEQDITNSNYVYKYNIGWSLNHPPPPDAVYWRFGYAGNSTMTYFIQTDVTAVTISAAAPYDGKTTIDITQWNVTLKSLFPGMNIEPYEFEAGDRMRVITDAPPGGAYDTPINIYYDEEITAYDSTNNLLVLNSFISPTAIGVGSIIEIYRPQKTEDAIYYEIGATYEIYEDSGVRYHKGDTQDQTALLPATGSMANGDIYHITRYVDAGSDQIYPMESMWASDFYDSEVWGQGKIGLVDNIGKAEVNNIRYSDQFIQATKVNGLNKFQLLNYESVTNKFGRVSAIVEIGHTLRVYLESNGISIPVGRTSYSDATGNDMVVASDKILGVQRIDSEGYGTVFPESICKVGTHVYFFDSRKGCFIRDSLNGAYPISGKFSMEGGTADFKMEGFFKNKAAAIKDGGESNFHVFTGWDETKKLLIVAFDDIVIGDDDEIVAFHEPSNRWATFLIRENNEVTLNTKPSWWSKSGNNLFSYYNGDVYIHDESAGYCNFYGIQRGIEYRVYSSDANNQIKLYEAIGVHCNQKLSLEVIYVYTDEVVGGYMQSRIPSAWWKKIEGVYMAPYLRNSLTNGSVSTKDLLNGDFLRGYVIENRLTKSSVTTELNLFKVDIFEEKSNV